MKNKPNTIETIIAEFDKKFKPTGTQGLTDYRDHRAFLRSALEKVEMETREHKHNFELKYVNHPYLPKVEQYTICSECGQQPGTQTYFIDKDKLKENK